MPGQYDDSMKKLVDANPQDFVSMVLGVGEFLLALPTELKLVHIYADALLKVIVNEMLMLLHLEFQSDHDERKQQRLHEYNTFASRQYDDLPVCSCVIHLRKRSDIPASPFIRILPTGEEFIRFHYKSIELWNWNADELLRSGWVGLFPLVPLTQGGKEHKVVQKIIGGLLDAGKTDLLVLVNAFASLAFEDESEADQEWLERTFAMLNDTLRNTRAYQKILNEGREKGREEGLEKGREEALHQQRQTLLDIILERFPSLVRSMKKHIEAIEDPTLLSRLIVKMSTVKTAKEAKQLLLTVSGDNEQN